MLIYGRWAVCHWVDRRVEPKCWKSEILQLCVHVHVSTIMQYLCTVHALCGYARHLRTCRYAAVHVNRPSGISQDAAVAVNRTKECWTIVSDDITDDFLLLMKTFDYTWFMLIKKIVWENCMTHVRLNLKLHLNLNVGKNPWSPHGSPWTIFLT